MKKKYIFGFIIILVALASGLFILFRVFLTPSGIDIDKLKYPVTGIDISKHTGRIDFHKIKKQKIDFIFIKSTEGEDHKDQAFERNYLDAKACEIPVGTYHFFRFNKSGKKQAKNYLKAIADKKFELPFVVDVETWGNPTTKSKEEIIHELAEFINMIESNTNKKVIIYSNEDGYSRFIKGNFKNDIWICSFNERIDKIVQWVFWQHSHKGKYDFAEGWVDVNTFNGNKADWNRYLNK
jgi:lysozyme